MGETRGRAYRWDEGDIIERAKVSTTYSTRNRDAEAALISIWLMGFEYAPLSFAVPGSTASIEDKSQYEKLVERHAEGDASLVRAAGHRRRRP